MSKDPFKSKNNLLVPVMMFLLGAALGVASKLLDIYTFNLGNIFSQMSIWILLGTLIAIFSKTKGKAALNVFVFCVGMFTGVRMVYVDDQRKRCTEQDYILWYLGRYPDRFHGGL